MSAEIVVAVLLAIVAFEAYWINTLLNKLMSRNYHEYQVAKGTPDAMLPTQTQEKVDDDPLEDLNHVGSPF